MKRKHLACVSLFNAVIDVIAHAGACRLRV